MSNVAKLRTLVGKVATSARIPVFYVTTAIFLGFLVLALHEPMQFGLFAWTPEYTFFTHRVHHVMLGSALVLLALSVAVQLVRPAKRVGAYLYTATYVAVLTLVVAIGDGLAAAGELLLFVILAGIVGLLHPGLRSFRPSKERLDRRMAALALVAAIPLAAFAAIQVNLQMTAVDDHVLFGHYLFMAAGSLTIGIGAFVASFRPSGWRFLAYGVAVLLALVGVSSVAFSGGEQGTNFGVVGGILAVVWAVGFVAVAESGAARVEGSRLNGWLRSSDSEVSR